MLTREHAIVDYRDGRAFPDCLDRRRHAHYVGYSSVEEKFAAKFGKERDGWCLERETEVLADGQTAFVPDFVFRHADGTTVLFEIVGFWTPEYLAKKRETLRRFRGRTVLLAVPERSLREEAEPGENVVVYKTAIQLGPVMEALERFRRRPEQTGNG